MTPGKISLGIEFCYRVTNSKEDYNISFVRHTLLCFSLKEKKKAGNVYYDSLLVLKEKKAQICMIRVFLYRKHYELWFCVESVVIMDDGGHVAGTT